MESGETLAGKRALVTGAGTGIGEGIAQEFARQGAAVVLHYAFDYENALQTAARINERGGQALTIQGDLTQVEECWRVVDEGANWLGGLDILVNNAGVTARAEFLDVTPELFDRLFQLNMRGYFFCAQQATRWMLRAGRGSIVNLASIHAFASFPTYSVYAATKGAIVAFTRQLATELVPRRIRVNAIAPGMVEVQRHLSDPSYDHDTVMRNAAWGRVGTPQDAAYLATFLVSDAADYINGQVINLDAGTMARLPGNYLPMPQRSAV